MELYKYSLCVQLLSNLDIFHISYKASQIRKIAGGEISISSYFSRLSFVISIRAQRRDSAPTYRRM